jgi:hypothetical protein
MYDDIPFPLTQSTTTLLTYGKRQLWHLDRFIASASAQLVEQLKIDGFGDERYAAIAHQKINPAGMHALEAASAPIIVASGVAFLHSIQRNIRTCGWENGRVSGEPMAVAGNGFTHHQRVG